MDRSHYGSFGGYGGARGGGSMGRGYRGEEWGFSSPPERYTGDMDYGRGDRGSNFGRFGETMYGGSDRGSYGEYGASRFAGGESHRGKGPKGFKRSDDRLKEQVSEALADHHEIDASDIEVSVKDGEVTLVGTVDDRQTKRMTERVVESITGITEVHNQLRLKQAQAEQPKNGTAPATNPQNRPH